MFADTSQSYLCGRHRGQTILAEPLGKELKYESTCINSYRIRRTNGHMGRRRRYAYLVTSGPLRSDVQRISAKYQTRLGQV